jgi:cardiolipin synthase
MSGVWTVPNIISSIRIIIVPAFVTALLYDRFDYALILFITAALSDAVDGFIARAAKQKTRFGAFLDPLADKFLLITSFIILFAVYGLIPKWLVITVISRDVIVTLGWFLLYISSHIKKPEPSLIGKAANDLQMLLIVYILLTVNFPGIPAPTVWMFIPVAGLTIISGLWYMYRGLQLSNEK